MRVVDLDRDMADVIPTGTTRDSEFLFARMTEATLERAAPAPGGRVLDVASGFGQDALALAARGARVVGAEPSARMTGWARLQSAKAPASPPLWVRGWGDALPFADGVFDAVLCKGAIDHFDRPELAIAEMARVAKPRGRVVLAIANFESLACRAARGADDLREGWLGRAAPRAAPLRRARRPLHALRPRPDARAGGAQPRARERPRHLPRLGPPRLDPHGGAAAGGRRRPRAARPRLARAPAARLRRRRRASAAGRGARRASRA